MASNDPRQAIRGYVTDMLAVEEHCRRAIDGQIADVAGHPDVQSMLREFRDTCAQHVSAIESLLDARGGRGARGLGKKMVTRVAGIGAAAIDLVRNEDLPKDLRDDFTAFNLAAIGYVMLHTTGRALGDDEVAALALRHQQDYGHMLQVLHRRIPTAVIEFLREEGLPVDDSVLPDVERQTGAAWASAETPSAGAAGIG